MSDKKSSELDMSNVEWTPVEDEHLKDLGVTHEGLFYDFVTGNTVTVFKNSDGSTVVAADDVIKLFGRSEDD